MSKQQKSRWKSAEEHGNLRAAALKDHQQVSGTKPIETSVATPFVFLDEEAPPVPPDPGARLFLSHSVRCEAPVESSSLSCKFVLQGEETYIIQGRAHRLLAGDLIIVDAGVEGSIDIPRRERTIAVSAYLGKSVGDALLPGYGPVMRPARNGALGNLLRRIATTYAHDSEARPHDASPLIEQIENAAVALAIQAADRLEGISLKKPVSRQELLTRLERTREYLEENVARAVTLPQVATVSGMSPFHLTRHFRSVFGEPPMRYHRRIRLEQVADMLGRGGISPSAAAEMLGYNDLPTFTRAFKSVIGVPPSVLLPAK